jgi:predicted PurR-regulated permease PerM
MAQQVEVPPPVSASPAGNSLLVGGVLILAIAALYVGSGIFVPLVLAILVAFALAPLVRLLRMARLPHIAAVLIAVAAAALIITAIAYLVTTQLVRLASDLPAYQQTVAEKVRSLQQSMPGGDIFDRIGGAVEGLGEQVGGGEQGTGGATQPIPVIVENAPQSPWAIAQGFLGSLLAPFATAAIVTVFVIFLLLEREDLRDRFLKLVSRGDLQTSTKVMNEAAKRVSRYLLIQFTVNLTYGLIFGAGLWIIGIPNAILWGLFAALFRYIPFVGTLIAASIPFALAFAVDPGWSMLLSAIGLFVTLELVTTNAIEPRLYGSSTGLSPLAVIIAAIFWATLWGPIGLILATPLTVCLVVIGRYVPQLAFLEILLGSEPVLVAEEKLYQRLLAGNTEEAIELAETHLAEGTAEEFYDNVAIPALRLAEADRLRKGSELAHRRTVVEGITAIVHEIEHMVEEDNPTGEAEERPESDATPSVLCIGGRTELDGAAAEMIAQVVRRAALEVRVAPPLAVRQEGIGQLDLAGIDVLCLAYLGANPRSYARFVSRRIKRRSPEVKVVVCLFHPADALAGDDLAQQLGADAVAHTVAAAEAQVIGWAGRAEAMEEMASEDAQLDTDALHQLRRISRHNQRYDEFAAQVAAEFKVPLALITILDADAGPGASTEPLKPSDADLGAQALTLAVVEAKSTLVIEDVSEDPRFADNAFLLENGVRFFAGAPLTTGSGATIGALSVVDIEQRSFSPEATVRLQHLADSLITDIDNERRLQMQQQAETRGNEEQEPVGS